MQLHPLEQCLKTADMVVKSGGDVYQEFTCAGCGAKQTIPQANTFYESATCEECNHLTDIKTDGCNYLVIFGSMPLDLS